MLPVLLEDRAISSQTNIGEAMADNTVVTTVPNGYFQRYVGQRCKCLYIYINHNYNKIVKSDWLSTALISALIGQFNRTVRVMPK